MLYHLLHIKRGDYALIYTVTQLFLTVRIKHLITGGNEYCIGHICLFLGINKFPFCTLPFDINYIDTKCRCYTVSKQFAAQVINNLLCSLEVRKQECLVLKVLERSL